MNGESPNQQALEVIISERVFSRLKTQMLVVYALSLFLGGGLAWSLAWEYEVLEGLARDRISEYQLAVAENLEELHRIDLEEVAVRTRPASVCTPPLAEEDAASLLARELGRPAEPQETRLLLEKAEGFGVCDIGEVAHHLADEVSMAKVDTVYRLLLGRPADPIGRFIYGYWLASGIGIEAVWRDIMTSPEFARLKKLRIES
jgi:hypothetical protein